MQIIEETIIQKKLVADENKLLISKELDATGYPINIVKEIYINDDEEANNYYEIELQTEGKEQN